VEAPDFSPGSAAFQGGASKPAHPVVIPNPLAHLMGDGVRVPDSTLGFA